MSAFSFPGEQPAPSGPQSGSGPLVPPASAPRNLPAPPANPRLPKPPPGRRAPESRSNPDLDAPPADSGAAAPPLAGWGSGSNEEAEWRAVYQEFVHLKQQCGETVDGFTYEKFEQTLRKNRDALINRHGAKKVKFSVYVKDGKAALKASPLKD